MYDPTIGRWWSMDPLAEKYYSISPYAYCANNPINFIDFLGMAPGSPTYDGGTLPTIYINGTSGLSGLDLCEFQSLQDMFEIRVLESNGEGYGNPGVSPFVGQGLWKSDFPLQYYPESGFQKTLEKYNEIVKNANSVADPAIELANLFTKNEIAWLVRTGNILRAAGYANVTVDGCLTIYAIYNGKPWGRYAYNTVIGTVGAMGPVGATVAVTVDSSVKGIKYFAEMIHWINTTGQEMIFNKIIRGY